MKKEYLIPITLCLQLEEEGICTTSEIDMNGETDHFDSRRMRRMRRMRFEENEEFDNEF